MTCSRPGIKPRDPAAKEQGQALIKNLVEQLLDPGTVVAKGVTRTINQRIAAIDAVLSKQVNAIMHHAGVPEAGGLLARAAQARHGDGDRRDR